MRVTSALDYSYIILLTTTNRMVALIYTYQSETDITFCIHIVAMHKGCFETARV